MSAPVDDLPPLYPFQDDVIARTSRAPRAICLAVEMGLGKTRISIEVALRSKAQRVLVIAPKIALTSWPVEVRRWAPGARMIVLRPGQAVPLPSTSTTFVAINYEALSLQPAWFRAWVSQWQPDLLVLDECHYLKTHDSKRTRLVYGVRCDGVGGVVENVPKVILLSGTPAPNYTSELWPHLRALCPQAITIPRTGRPMNLWEFRLRYSIIENNKYGERVVGSKNTAALREACDGFFVRIRTRDVLKDLPPIVWTAEPIAAVMPPMPKALADAAQLGGDALLDWLRSSGLELATIRRAIGMAKVRAAADWIEYFMQNNPDRSLVVFGHHRDVLQALDRRLNHYEPLLVHGGTPLQARVRAVELFQARRRRLWIGQMQASGTAITLTAAHDVCFIEQDWVPAVMAQAAARTHRIGQDKAVMARVFSVPDSLDDAITRILIAKARAIAVMFDNQQEKATA